MLAINGICTVCKNSLDIISAGMVCSMCEKYYHGMCMEPKQDYDTMEEFVINTKEWRCTKCIIKDENYQFEPRTLEDMNQVRRKAEMVYELREIIMLIDDVLTDTTRQCNELKDSADKLKKQNTELKKRIHLHSVYRDPPLTLPEWVKQRKLLKVGDRLPPIKRKLSDGEMARIKNRFQNFMKKRHIVHIKSHKKRKDFITTITSYLRKCKNWVRGRKTMKSINVKGSLIYGVYLSTSNQQKRSFNQVILFIALVCHTFLGAFVFNIIEGNHEKTFKEEILSRRHDITTRLLMIEKTFKLVSFERSNETKVNITAALLSDYHDFLVSLTKEYDNGRLYVQKGNWDYLGSVFFCATTAMTIGYGDIVPVTVSGKIFAMVFGLIGIPIFITFTASLGRSLNRLIQNCVADLNRCIQRDEDIGYRNNSITNDDEVNGFPVWLFCILHFTYLIIGGMIFMFGEQWNFFQSIYFVFLNVATIGMGDMVPTNRQFVLASIVFIIGGHVLTAIGIHMIIGTLRRKFQSINLKLEIKATEYGEKRVKSTFLLNETNKSIAESNRKSIDEINSVISNKKNRNKSDGYV